MNESEYSDKLEKSLDITGDMIREYRKETAALRAELDNMQALAERLSLEKSEVLIEQGKLATELAKAQADLAAAQAENARMKEALDKESSRYGLAFRALQTITEDSFNWNADRIRRCAKLAMYPSNKEIEADIAAMAQALELQPVSEPLAAENATLKTQTTPSRCRVNWNRRGFSSGSYEVLGHSDEKQAYMLNISTDENKPMLKMVRMADCEAAS